VAIVGTTALVIQLPEAEALLDKAKRLRPDLVRPGLPAHVTVLYPFIPAEGLTAELERSVTEFARITPSARLNLIELTRAAGFLAAATPELQSIVDSAVVRWPQVNAYGGRFGVNPAAHLTIAMGASENEIDFLVAEIEKELPLPAHARQLHLVELTVQGWRVRLEIPFA
jgi:hypothetical protein